MHCDASFLLFVTHSVGAWPLEKLAIGQRELLRSSPVVRCFEPCATACWHPDEQRYDAGHVLLVGLANAWEPRLQQYQLRLQTCHTEWDTDLTCTGWQKGMTSS